MGAAPLILVASCRSVDITPAALERNATVEHAHALENWTEAVALANDFLASPFRCTLPEGRFELTPEGMRFVINSGAVPIQVRATTWGDLVIRAGFVAQEREYGFVVGAEPPDKDELIDHSFFRNGTGGFYPPGAIAETTLYETTHVIYREGTVGSWNAFAYYMEAIFLFRYSNHSGERHANATSEEFEYFNLERSAKAANKSILREVFEKHLAQGATDRCTHGGKKE